MLIIGERINATRNSIAQAMNDRNADFIAHETKIQEESGADFIDVNAGSDPAKELENLTWAVEVVQENTTLPLCIDSAGAEGFRRALEVLGGDEVMLNSVNGEKEHMKEIFPIAADCDARLIGLLMDDDGLPTGVEDRLNIVEKLLEGADKAGVSPDKLYIDPCVQPLGTNPDQATAVVETVERITEEYPDVNTTCGLTNIGFGLPYRGILNRSFLSLLIGAGVDSAIADPTERDLMATALSTEALCGKDDYCMNYMKADRAGLLRPNQEDE